MIERTRARWGTAIRLLSWGNKYKASNGNNGGGEKVTREIGRFLLRTRLYDENGIFANSYASVESFLCPVSNTCWAPMTSTRKFRRILPALQLALGIVFGGWGLWQRNQVLSHDYLFGIGWNTTARFHVWPWPFKFAVIANLPAFIAGVLLSLPISAAKPELPETVQLAPSLLFVIALWYWIGLRLDQQCRVSHQTLWVSLAVFVAVCLTGALVPMGYTGFLVPYGALVWLIATFAFRRVLKPLPRL